MQVSVLGLFSRVNRFQRRKRLPFAVECFGDLGFVFGSVQIEKAATGARYR
jgi:hypothetical protein